MCYCLFSKNGTQVVIWYVRAFLWTGPFPMMKRSRRGESGGSSPRAQTLVMKTSGRSVKLHCVTTTTEVWLLSTRQPRAFKDKNTSTTFQIMILFSFLTYLFHEFWTQLELNHNAYKVMSSWDLWALGRCSSSPSCFIHWILAQPSLEQMLVTY